MNTPNPFYNVGPIDDVQMFFNRRTLIDTLLNSLFTERPQCCSIVGQRKIGKSSLVQHIFRPSVLAEFQRDGSRYCPIYFNCQIHANAGDLTSRDKFFRVLVQEITQAAPSHIIKSLDVQMLMTEPYLSWKHLLHNFDQYGYNLIVVFDEFDKAVAQEGLIREGVFGILRGFASDVAAFKWITCSNQYLNVLFTQAFDDFNVSRIKRISESDFYNISPANVISLFSQADISALITTPTQRMKTEFSQQEIEMIVECGGTFPYFIQRACFHTINARLAGESRPENIIRQFVTGAKPIWDTYWSHLDHSHQQALVEIAHNGSSKMPERVINHLKEMALVDIDHKGNLQTFSKEYGRYIRMQRDEKPGVTSMKAGVSGTKPVKKRRGTAIQGLADVLIVAITPVEIKAIINIFGKQINHRRKRIKRHIIAKKVYFDLGKIQGAHIFLVQSTTMGSTSVNGSLMTIHKAIEDLSPSAIIMVGIAFGVNSGKQAIGDILVSERIMSYEPQRVGTSKSKRQRIIPRGSRADATSRLVDKFKSGELDWPGANVSFGLILSGDKLVDNLEFRNQLLRLEPEALGGEMEGAGLYIAAHQHKVDWIIVKAICDWADGNKDQNQQEWQKSAARNAAKFTFHVLKQGGWSD